MPLSEAARAAGPDWLPVCLNGGDDYELLLAVPPERTDALARASRESGVPVTRIGTFRADAPAVSVMLDGRLLPDPIPGWSHF